MGSDYDTLLAITNIDREYGGSMLIFLDDGDEQ